MRKVGLVVFGFLWIGLACEPTDPCQRYVDYVCDCHDGEEGFDCQELRSVFADADPQLQEDCATDLDALRAEDEANGFYCDTTAL